MIKQKIYNSRKQNPTHQTKCRHNRRNRQRSKHSGKQELQYPYANSEENEKTT